MNQQNRIILLASLLFFILAGIGFNHVLGYEVYTSNGNSGYYSNTNTTHYNTIPEMQYTVYMDEGDKALVFMNIVLATPQSNEGHFGLTANNNFISIEGSVSGTSLNYQTNYQIVGIYEAKNDGNVIFRGVWKGTASGLDTPQQNRRYFTVIKFEDYEPIEFYEVNSTTRIFTLTTEQTLLNCSLDINANENDLLWIFHDNNIEINSALSTNVALELIVNDVEINDYDYKHGMNGGNQYRNENLVEICSFYNVTTTGIQEIRVNYSAPNDGGAELNERQLIVIKIAKEYNVLLDWNHRDLSSGLVLSPSQYLSELDISGWINEGTYLILTFQNNWCEASLSNGIFQIEINGTFIDSKQFRMGSIFSTTQTSRRYANTHTVTYQVSSSGHYDIRVYFSGSGSIRSDEARLDLIQLYGVYTPPIIHIPQPYDIDRITIRDSRGNQLFNDSWLYMSEVYTLEIDVWNPTYTETNFSDTQRNVEYKYYNTTVLDELTIRNYMVIDEENYEYVIGLISSDYELINETVQAVLTQGGVILENRTNRKYTLSWTFVLERNIVDSLDVWFSAYTNSSINTWYTNTTDIDSHKNFIYLNIYNLGGLVEYTFVGNASRIQGGDVFELTTGNGIASAKASTLFRRLQHMHTLVELEMYADWDAVNGYFVNLTNCVYQFGFDYEINNTFIKGWKIRLLVNDYDVGHHNNNADENWIDWEINFYQYNITTSSYQIVSSQQIITNCWGYDLETSKDGYYDRFSTQIWVDLWFNKMNSSTVVGARCNAYYYGMYEVGTPWFGYGEFKPMFGSTPVSTSFFDLLDENDNVINCYPIEKVRFWSMVNNTVASSKFARMKNYEVLNFKVAQDRMEGIDTPPIVETKVLDMPQGGFLTPIVKAIESLGDIIFKGAMGFIRTLLSSIDTLLVYLGLPPVFAILTQLLSSAYEVFKTMWDYMFVIIDYMIVSLQNLFSSIFLLLPRYVLFVGVIVDVFIQYYQNTILLFTGGIGNMSNFWTEYNLMELLELYIIGIFPFVELARIQNSDNPFQTFKEDLTTGINLIYGLFNIMRELFEFMLRIIQSIIGVF